MKSLAIINKKLHIKGKKSESIISALVTVIFVVIALVSFIILDNARAEAKKEYAKANGDADIIANLTIEEYKKIKDVFDTNELFAVGRSDGDNAFVDINGTNVAIFRTNLNLLNSYYYFSDSDNFTENDIIVNSLFYNSLNDKKRIDLFDTTYNIVDHTSKFDFFSVDKPIIIINDNSETNVLEEIEEGNYSGLILFQKFNHNKSKVNSAIQKFSQNEITYINCYANYQTAMSEYENAKNLVDVLVIFASFIVFVLSFTFFMLKLKKETSFWQSLRKIGLSSRQMVRAVFLENAVIVVLGFIMGFVLSIPISAIVCVATDVAIFSLTASSSDIWLVFVLDFVFTILPVMFVAKKSSKDILLQTRLKKKTKTKPMIITFVIGIVCLLCGIVGKVILGDAFASGAFFLYILAVLFLTIPIINFIFKNLLRLKNKNIKICSLLANVNFNAITLVSLAVVLCVIIIYTMADFTFASEYWARNLAKEQLNFDLRASVQNNATGNEELKIFEENNEFESKGEYYLSAGKIGNFSTYIISEISQDVLNKMYGSDKSFSSLKDDELVISSLMAKKSDLSLQSEVTISLNNVKKNCKVVDIVETYDYNGAVVFVSQSLFDTSAYTRIFINVDFLNDIDVDDFISNYASEDIALSSVAYLANVWEDNIVNGIDIIVGITAVVLLGLLILLYCVIRGYIDNRARDFAILHTLGLEKNSTFKILVIEWCIVQLVILFILVLFCPFIAKNFFIFATHASGFYIKYTWSIASYLLILSATFAVMFLLPLKSFYTVKKKQSLDKLKSL